MFRKDAIKPIIHRGNNFASKSIEESADNLLILLNEFITLGYEVIHKIH